MEVWEEEETRILRDFEKVFEFLKEFITETMELHLLLFERGFFGEGAVGILHSVLVKEVRRVRVGPRQRSILKGQRRRPSTGYDEMIREK